MRRDHTYKPGDKVMLHREHLRNIGVYTGEMCFVIGTVTHVQEYPDMPALVTLVWTGYSPSWPDSYTREYEGTEQRVLACNLEPSPFTRG